MGFGHLRCLAMIEAGIEDAESQEGIDFCVNHCPYPCCILFETPNDKYLVTKRVVNKMLAWRLYSIGLPIQTIADILGKSKGTVGTYLGEVRKGD